MRRRHAMTLVEVMVAMALGMILIGVVTFVWLQSNKLFTTTLNKLETYQRLRTVLDIMERDLANTNRTVDMEFYVDKDPDDDGPLQRNGHYDNDDDVVSVGAEDFRRPRDPQDPLFQQGEEEFGIAGFPPLLPGQDEPYLYAPTVLSNQPYGIEGGYTERRNYWNDEVYVRTFAMVDGLNRPAMVHYRLVRQADGRSALRRRVWFLNENNELVFPGDADNPPTDRTQVLSHGVCDLKVGFFFKETASQEIGATSGVGEWYHVGNPGDWEPPAEALGNLDEARGFLSARGEKALSDYHKQQFGGMNAVSFVYEGVARFEDQEAGGVVLRGLGGLEDGEPGDYAASDKTVYDIKASFPGVRPGDKFFVFDATDDDDAQSIVDGTPVPKEAGAFFPDQILTVSLIYTDATQAWVAVKFEEPISFFRLGNDWLGEAVGGEPDIEILEGDLDTSGPERKIRQSFNVRYRVGFLPAAFLVRLSCDDQYNQSLVQMERVIRLLQQ